MKLVLALILALSTTMAIAEDSYQVKACKINAVLFKVTSLVHKLGVPRDKVYDWLKENNLNVDQGVIEPIADKVYYVYPNIPPETLEQFQLGICVSQIVY